VKLYRYYKIQGIIRKHFRIVPKDPDHVLVEMNESIDTLLKEKKRSHR
jgi:hypothetical protein